MNDAPQSVPAQSPGLGKGGSTPAAWAGDASAQAQSRDVAGALSGDKRAGEGSARETNRFLALDGVRGIAIAMVVLYHAGFNWAVGGWIGVDLFFALSGFLITWLLLKEWERYKSISLRRFYRRRLLRLVPALSVTVALAVILVETLPFSPLLRRETLEGAPTVMLFLTNVLQIAFPWDTSGILAHTWSLGIEMQFYILWPLTLLAMLRWQVPRRQMIMATLALAVTSAAFVPLWWNPGDIWQAYGNLAPRSEALLFGCAGALIYTSPMRARLSARRFQLSAVVLLAGAALVWMAVTLVYTKPLVWYHAGLTMVDLTSGVLVLGVALGAAAPIDRFLSWWPLVGLGRISYSLYLLHFLVMTIPIGANDLEATILRIAISVVAAILSYNLIEQPFLRIKDRHSRVRVKTALLAQA